MTGPRLAGDSLGVKDRRSGVARDRASRVVVQDAALVARVLGRLIPKFQRTRGRLWGDRRRSAGCSAKAPASAVVLATTRCSAKPQCTSGEGVGSPRPL